jgi:signal transduction histidine kinase/CheY-like chemotaxis protein
MRIRAPGAGPHILAMTPDAPETSDRRLLRELEQLSEFQELVTRLSTGFISLPDDELDRAIDRALAEIGEYAGVDRSYVFLFSDDLALASNTHEWCAEGVEPERDHLQDLPTELFQWWMARLERFEDVYVPDVRELGNDGDSPRAFLESQGIRALIAVPLVYGARLLGFVGFDAVRGPRPWGGGERRLLRLVGDIFANGIQRKRANRALAGAEDQLRQAQKMDAVGRLAGGIAHDFNNILTAIRGYAEILQRKLGPDGPGGRELGEITAATARAANLTRQLLVFSRRQPEKREVIDLNSIVGDLRNLLGPLIGEEIRIETDLAPGLAAVEIDPGHVEQVLLNLVLNARDAMPRGGRIVIATRSVAPEDPDAAPHPGPLAGARVALSVSDTGIGVPDSIRSRIFEPFFTTKELGKGTGLGLAVVYGIVQQAGGSISVHSTPEEGSTFEVLLPATERRPARAPRPQPEAAPAAAGGVVLVVEDEEPVRRFVAHTLREHGFLVLEAGAGQEALRVAEAHPRPIDVLVSDVVIPDFRGPELERRLRARQPGFATVFMSGYAGPFLGAEDAEPALPGAGARFLQKPFETSALLRAVTSALGERRREPAGVPSTSES